MTYAVEFQNVSRLYGDVRAVDGVSIGIRDGEFFSMLGPSGSGKTTCLRLIAGFEQLSGGTIHIFGQPASELPPWQRDVNTVFQDYALFPHMSILDNVAYGLMVKGMAKKARHARAQEALEKVALGFAHHRKPSQLSGGQRQRVAIARALVNQPRVLLLDEPLGALDLKLREQMQVELKKLQQSLGITFIFVTHDQSEALSMSDRVASRWTPRRIFICIRRPPLSPVLSVPPTSLRPRRPGGYAAWRAAGRCARSMFACRAAARCRCRVWCRRCSIRGRRRGSSSASRMATNCWSARPTSMARRRPAFREPGK